MNEDWANLFVGLAHLALRSRDGYRPLLITDDDELLVAADPADFSTDELEMLKLNGFEPTEDGFFVATRIGNVW